MTFLTGREIPNRDLPKTPGMRRVEEQHGGRDIADLITDLYYHQHLNQSEVAEKLEIPPGTLGDWMIRLGISRQQMAQRAVDREAS